MAPAGYEHGDIAMGLGAHMRIHVEDNQLGRVFAAETGFRLSRNPDTVRAPDAAFVRQQRFPPLQERTSSSYFPGAPDLAVEVVSPNDTAADVQAKVQDWLSHATQLVWVVYPSSRTVMVCRADGTASILTANDVLDGEDVLPGFRFPLERLFASS